MMTDTRSTPRCAVCDFALTPEAQVDIDAPLSPPGPLARKLLDCTWPAGPLRSMQLSALAWPGPRSCHAHDGEKCARGDDAQSCPFTVWVELDCSGPDADCEGQLVEALPELAGTELEGVAHLLSDAWSFVDDDDDPTPYTWCRIRLGRSAHERAHTQWCRESAARFMAQARITTGDCEGPGCVQ